VKIRLLAPIIAASAIVACATDRYHSNLRQVYVTPWSHVARGDIERVVALVTRATPQPIVGLTQDRGKHRKVFVCTCWPDENHPAEDVCTGFELQKKADDWHIVFRGSMSRIVVGLTLSNPQ
jgi:hypothetical protein